MHQLKLIGIHPLDFKGEERLEKLLEVQKPSIICLDCDESQLDLIVDFISVTLTQEGLPFLVPPYYIALPYAYAIRHPETDLVYLKEPLDESMDLFKRLNSLEPFKGIFSDGNYAEISRLMNIMLSFENQFAFQKVIDGSYYGSGIGISHVSQEESKKYYTSKDRRIAAKLRKIFCSVPPNSEASIIYICDIYRIFGDYQNIYKRLRDLNPERIRLSDADELLDIRISLGPQVYRIVVGSK